MSRPKLVMVGNGMAGVRCVEEICALERDLYEITIFGSEPRPNYNRIMLSQVLQGDASLQDIVTHDWDWYAERGIRLYAGHPVIRIDTEARRVTTAEGRVAEYDRLILATGSSAFIPPLPGVGKPGVIGFRSVDDCRRMMEAAASYRKAAVIGGGLLGLEAARGLLNLGMDVTVVHNAAYLMNRQLDAMSSELLRSELEEQGMRFLFGKAAEKILGRKRAEGIGFSDGARLQADLIVMAVGIRPNVELAKSGGLWTNRAFVVDDYMETNVPGVYAVGECAEHEGTVYGLVAPLYEQGKVLAKVLCGRETEPYRGSVPYAQLKVSGVDVFSAGHVNEAEEVTVLQLYDGIGRTYKKVTARNGKVSGAILFGDVNESGSLLSLLRRGAEVSALERSGARSAEGGPSEAASAMSEQETVCQCNGVSKGTLVTAVREGGLRTVEQLRDRTKAAGSCGGCKPMVAAILQLALGGADSEPEREPAICGCTELGHEAVKTAIAEGGFASIGQAMTKLGWKPSEGCALCRGAIGYYMGQIEEGNGHSARLHVEAGGADAVARIGAELERRLQALLMPSAVHVAVVSGAEGTGLLVRDFGVAPAPAGWEIYAGGCAGRPVKQAQLIAVASTEDEALEMVAACLHGYRANAFYGEPVWRWLQRYGLTAIRETALDPDGREYWLNGRLPQRGAAEIA
ncbi:nitrite reductase large subunit NirB [Cohnella hongkongensis]|uniref:Nitrite reductase large subunit NirB n=1 Tax=Cohnella hongkongensis TaxID=178337 RepID=A0ABV9F5V8_9BACL